eukprot:13973311-Alexandrium_andersonii.AAC.1
MRASWEATRGSETSSDSRPSARRAHWALTGGSETGSTLPHWGLRQTPGTSALARSAGAETMRRNFFSAMGDAAVRST